jgi:1-acyl-sn-glycerol-3-phosphate acyltransferase
MIFTILMFVFLGFTVAFLFPFGVIAILFYFLGAKKLMTNVIYRIVQGWALLLIKVTGSTVTVTGKEHIPKEGGVCFVSNHEGYFDIMLLAATCGRPIGFIAKKELLLVPLFNIWIYMIGSLFIDRKNVKKAIYTINKGAEKIKSGSGMVIFPEGHRSKGRGIQPFHPGSLRLATMSEAPIVPVALEGSSNIFEKTGRVTTGAVMKVTFCEPIETKNLPLEHKKFNLSNRIFSIIKERLESRCRCIL